MVNMSTNIRHCWLHQICGAYCNGYFHDELKNDMLSKSQDVFDMTSHGFLIDPYNLTNNQINTFFLKEYPTCEKLMKYNAYD